MASLHEIRANIAQLRKKLENTPSYLGPWGLKNYLKDMKENPDVAGALLDLLKEYVSTGETLLTKQAKKPDLSLAMDVIEYSLDALDDPYYDNKENLLSKLLAFYGEGEGFGMTEKVLLLYLIVEGYRKGDYPWRGKSKAAVLAELVDQTESPLQIYQGLTAFYKSVLDLVSANKVAMAGVESLLKQGKGKDAALLARDGLSSAVNIPDYEFPTEEEIAVKFGENAEIVLAYPRYSGFKHDPVETTPEFQIVYDDVMEKAMAKYLSRKGAKIIQMLWSEMREGFAEHGIDWKDPQWMNPTARFD